MKKSILALLSLIINAEAYSQDSCSDVITKSYNNIYSLSYEKISTEINQIVAQGSTGRDDGNFNGELTFLDLVSTNFGASQIKSWQDYYRQNSSINIDNESLNLFISRTTSDAAIKAWAQCMNNKNWNVKVTGDIFSDFVLDITWDGGASHRPRINADPILNNIEITGNEVFKTRLSFPDGQSRTQGYKRLDDSKISQVVINFSGTEAVSLTLPTKPSQITKPEIPNFTPSEGQYYEINTYSGNKYLHTVSGTHVNGAQLWTWDHLTRNDFNFEFEKIEGNFYRIKARHSGKCFHIENASHVNTAKIIQWDCQNSNYFHFSFEPSPIEGYFVIKARHSGKCLEVQNASTTIRSAIWQGDCQNNMKSHSWFKFIPVQ